MGKIIYVDGGILIKTPYFKSPNSGAYYDIPPEGAEILKPNKVNENGYEYLEISDDYPQSIFNEYYAKGGLAAYQGGAEILHKDLAKSYKDYEQNIKDIQEIVNITGLNEKHQKILNRLLFINIIASVDTFICDTILTKITNEEKSLLDFFNLLGNSKKQSIQKFRDQNLIGKWEQAIIEEVLKLSYTYVPRIRQIYKKVFDISIEDTNGKMENHFFQRHVFAHRNGRRKDSSHIDISKDDLSVLIHDSNDFVDQIMSKISK